MDTCTLIVSTFMTLTACILAPECIPSADGQRVLCYPQHFAACQPKPTSYFSCTRPDGSTYTLPADSR